MCGMNSSSTVDEANRKKSKLGYHRQSVACSYCRRRKIRCIPSAYFEGKCENCTKSGKECRFLKVSEEGPGALAHLDMHQKASSRPLRAKSLGDRDMINYDTFDPRFLDQQYSKEDEQDLSSYDGSQSGLHRDSHSPQTNHREAPSPSLQMQPYPFSADGAGWMDTQSSYMQPPPFPPNERMHQQPWPPRPSLIHRSSEPFRTVMRKSEVGLLNCYPDRHPSTGSPVLDPFHLGSQQRQSFFQDQFTGHWPTFQGTPQSTGPSSSLQSERSSSVEGFQHIDVLTDSGSQHFSSAAHMTPWLHPHDGATPPFYR